MLTELQTHTDRFRGVQIFTDAFEKYWDHTPKKLLVSCFRARRQFSFFFFFVLGNRLPLAPLISVCSFMHVSVCSSTHILTRPLTAKATIGLAKSYKYRHYKLTRVLITSVIREGAKVFPMKSLLVRQFRILLWTISSSRWDTITISR